MNGPRRMAPPVQGLLGLCLTGLLLAGCGESSRPPGEDSPIAQGPVTFAADVAPIIFENCSSCHRPGQAAPFSLLTYDDVKKRGRQIVEVTQSRYMPPWLPAEGFADFVGTRRLSLRQIQTLQRWVESGAPEGEAGQLPPLPSWPEGWQQGAPDLVVTMPEPFTLAPEGPDVYRNFVVPIPVDTKRYVRSIEFDPGNWRIVHHAFFLFDQSRSARDEDVLDAEPGFGGLHTPTGVRTPGGFFLSWQPGKQPSPSPDGMAWPLEPGTDLVLQLHLQPTGKPEPIRSRLAFYFTDQPPTQFPLKLWLSSYDIDIPPGRSDYAVEDNYVLPTDVQVLGILPHAHYLGREMQCYALLPDGSRRWLMWIKQWDFNWQGDYRYASPIPLPKGTRVVMRYVYDNSTNNVANPNDPPQRVRYGLQSTDEMAELWLQVLPSSAEGRAAIEADYLTRALEDSVAYNEYVISQDPQDARAFADLGKAFLYQGRFQEAESALQRSIKLRQDLVPARYFLGLLQRMQARPDQALESFQQALTIDPDHAKSHGNLGFLLLEQGKYREAETHLRRALELDPKDALARQALEDIEQARTQPAP